jgi:hypothetical protein
MFVMQLSRNRQFAKGADRYSAKPGVVVMGILQNVDNLETSAAGPVGIL